MDSHRERSRHRRRVLRLSSHLGTTVQSPPREHNLRDHQPCLVHHNVAVYTPRRYPQVRRLDCQGLFLSFRIWKARDQRRYVETFFTTTLALPLRNDVTTSSLYLPSFHHFPSDRNVALTNILRSLHQKLASFASTYQSGRYGAVTPSGSAFAKAQSFGARGGVGK